MSEPTILLVEDDAAIGQSLVGALRAQGFDVQWARTGRDALSLATKCAVRLVLLDLSLPDLDGVEVCRRLRAIHVDLPVVIVTARHSEADAVVGLDAGADDYITKPFALAELLARVRAHLRRAGDAGAERHLSVGDVAMDLDSRRVHVGGIEIELRAKEFELLAFLIAEAGNAVTRERIMAEVWDEHWFGSTKTLDVHVATLRRRFGENPGERTRIETVRGVGFRFEPLVETAP